MDDRESEFSEERSHSEADWDEEEFDEETFDEEEFDEEVELNDESSHDVYDEGWMNDSQDRGSSFYDSSKDISRSENTHTNRPPAADEEVFEEEEDYSSAASRSRDSRSQDSRSQDSRSRGSHSQGSSRGSSFYDEEVEEEDYSRSSRRSQSDSRSYSTRGSRSRRSDRSGSSRSEDVSFAESRSQRSASHSSQRRYDERSITASTMHSSRESSRSGSRSGDDGQSFADSRDSRGSRSKRSTSMRSGSRSQSSRSYQDERSFGESSRHSESLESYDDGTRSFAESQGSSVSFADERDPTQKFNNSQTGQDSSGTPRGGSSRSLSRHSSASSRSSRRSRSGRSRSQRSGAISVSEVGHSTIEGSRSQSASYFHDSTVVDDESTFVGTFNDNTTVQEQTVTEDEVTLDDDSTFVHESITDSPAQPDIRETAQRPSSAEISTLRPPEPITSDDDSTFVDESILGESQSKVSNDTSHANSTICTTTLKSPGALGPSTHTLKTSPKKAKSVSSKQDLHGSFDTIGGESMQRPSDRFENEVKKPDSKLDLGLKTPTRSRSMGSYDAAMIQKGTANKETSPRRRKKKVTDGDAKTPESSGRQDTSLRTPQRKLSIAPDQHVDSDRGDGKEKTKRKGKKNGSEVKSPRPETNGDTLSQTATPETKNLASAKKTQSVEMYVEPIVENQLCSSIAVLGTMSDAGKSIITAGICRVLTNHGMRVAPFKGQNMSNNASPALLPEGTRRHRLYHAFQKAVGGEFPKDPKEKPDSGYGEIGTAQSLQAEACKTVPRVEMNPVLLKSGGQNKKGEYLCSVLVLGKQVARETYGDLGKRTTDLRTMVLESHQALAEVTDCDTIVMEGAGSCTELNLMERDIVNLPLVRSLQCPWLLVANIDCGGVFAQIVGTKMCVSNRDWSLCAGIVVNKLRGEAKYFEPGPEMIEKMVGKPVFVVPFLRNLNLPEEDGMGIERRLAWEASGQVPSSLSTNGNGDSDSTESKKPVVVVVAYPHTAISDDLCPLEGDPRFDVQWRRRRIPRPYPHTTAIVLPGSRLTQKDLKWLHDSGWATFIRKHVAAGGNVLGICGGYQMLGWSVDDPDGVEGAVGSKQGLGLLPIRTKIAPPEVKVVVPRRGNLYGSKTPIEGFELHCGQSEIVTELGNGLGSQIHPLIHFEDGKPEGMGAGRAKGTYVHGVLWSAEARVELLVPERKDFPLLKDVQVQDPLNRLADHLESCGLDFKTLQGMLSKHKK